MNLSNTLRNSLSNSFCRINSFKFARIFVISLFALFCWQNFVVADPLGRVDTIGNTWQDVQWGNANVGNMLFSDSLDGSVHVVWTYKPPPPDYYLKSYYNKYDPDIGWIYNQNGFDMFPQIFGSKRHSVGYIGMQSGRGDFEVLYICPSCIPSFSVQRAWWQNDHFVNSTMDSIGPQALEIMMNLDGNIQVLGGNDARLQYRRYRLSPFFRTEWEPIDTLTHGTYAIACSFVSNKTTISFLRQKTFGDNSFLTYDQNIYLVTSLNGLDWDWGGRVNITNFVSEDIFRPVIDNDIILDYNDNVHIVFWAEETHVNVTHPESTSVSIFKSFIWHWSAETDSFTIAASGWLPDSMPEWLSFGTWRGPVDHPKLAINPRNGYLYMLYNRQDPSDYSASGYINNDLWMTVSTDNGMNWAVGTNITDTHAPNCGRNCASEFQASISQIVNDTIQLSYLLDRDPGACDMREGECCEALVIYQKLPSDMIATTPLLPQYSIRTGPQSGINGNEHTELPGLVKFSAYPNPFNSTTTITLTGAEQTEIEIYDISGRLITTVCTGNGQALWDASSYSSGLYFARAAGGDTDTIKLILLK